MKDPIRNDLYQKTGGFMKGICHPKGETRRITEAGIEWVRIDAPYPLSEGGKPSVSHKDFLKEVSFYAERGLRSIVVSPYPDTFLEHGIDPRIQEGLKQVESVCAFMAKEYAPYRVCWQATNEMHIIHFRSPLTAAESKEFLIASLKGLHAGVLTPRLDIIP